jgi:hypothetical protein
MGNTEPRQAYVSDLALMQLRGETRDQPPLGQGWGRVLPVAANQEGRAEERAALGLLDCVG